MVANIFQFQEPHERVSRWRLFLKHILGEDQGWIDPGRDWALGGFFSENQHKGREPLQSDRLIDARLSRDLDASRLPGSDGEHGLQEVYGRKTSALAFYRYQVLDYLNSAMQVFIARQEMMFVATADGRGEADASFRAGTPGFVSVLDERTVAYPEYRGNGVMASLGNLTENPHVGILFIDFTRDKIGLHVNGRARIVENEELLKDSSTSAVIRADTLVTKSPRPERWVLVSVVEAYVHCAKHIPRMRKLDQTVQWGTDDGRAKSGDYFAAKSSRRHKPLILGDRLARSYTDAFGG